MENVNGLRKGFILDPQGNRLLPITHINLVIGNNGETLSGTLERITETIAIMQESGGIITVETEEQMNNLNTANVKKGAICYVSTKDKYYSYSANGSWKPMQTSGGGSGSIDDGYSHIWVGPDPPLNENMLWLDTNSDGVIEDEADLELLYGLRELVSELQTTITVLDKRISDLEKGIIINPNPGPSPTPDEDNILLLEDNTPFLLEDGSNLLLEIQSTPPVVDNENVLLFEDGIEILLEDNSKLLLENGISDNSGIVAFYDSSDNSLKITGNDTILFVSNKTLNIIDTNIIVSNEILNI